MNTSKIYNGISADHALARMRKVTEITSYVIYSSKILTAYWISRMTPEYGSLWLDKFVHNWVWNLVEKYENQ